MTGEWPAPDAVAIDRVRRYYDTNTRGFVRAGHGGATGAIHRAVWGPGVVNREQAFRYVEDRIAALLAASGTEERSPRHVVDLGCGVGASLCHIVRSVEGLTGTGVTLSRVQVGLARARARLSEVSRRVSWREADFCALPAGMGAADAAYAIESFVHAPDADRFLDECGRLIRPGGLLIICDDFRSGHPGPEAHRTLAAFCRGWRINTFVSRNGLVERARAAGFALEEAEDLTRYLELRRLRDRLLAPLAVAAGALRLDHPRIANIVGGAALQRALTRGWVEYDWLVFRRAPDGSTSAATPSA